MKLSFNHTGTVALATDRLLLRRFEYTDIEGMLYNWIANPLVQHNYGEPTYDNIDSVKELLNKWIPQYEDKSFYRWAIILKETNENIGQIAFCCVYTEIETAEIEYCIGETYWGNGYAGEALSAVLKYSFEVPKFSKLEAFHRIANPNSGKVLQKSIMKRVSNAHRYELTNEQPKDKIFYALTRDEYFDSYGHL